MENALNLGFLLGRRSPPLVGMDVSASSIKVVELGRGRSGDWQLEHCAIELLEPDWVVDGLVERFDAVAEAGRRALHKSGSRARRVAMAIPAAGVISKKLALPAELSEEEMEVQVEAEANQYIPFSLDEVSLDFYIIGPSQHSPGDVDVMIAASRRDRVEDRQALAEAMGLKPVVIEVETNASRLAAQQAMNLAGNSGVPVVALLELGGQSSVLQVFRGDELLYEREHGFGGNQLTQMLVHQYGFSEKEAEAKKRSADLPTDYLEVVQNPFVQVLTGQIQSALRLFFTTTPHNRVDRLLLGGGGASLQGLTDVVGQRLDVPCEILNPFAHMSVPTQVLSRGLNRYAPSCLTACGLAMRRFLQ